jgi:hypothetical protein
MKKFLAFIITIVVISSCATTKETGTTNSESRTEKKLAEQAVIKRAVESRRFIIKLDRLYFSRGGMIELQPRLNYIIIDGEKAIISVGYLGRQYDIRPIAGINMRGATTNYILTSKQSRGIFEIKTRVTNNKTSFDLYLTIGKNGSCSASLSNIMIDYVNYRGYIVPIKDQTTDPVQYGKEI